ncbi:MAG TPA: hypothetical protein ENH49_06370 [Candidatus Marinimicrobia bacterium]|nr:hypothetical protein [Candidatus Neomarinimicrobiota bacterium]
MDHPQTGYHWVSTIWTVFIWSGIFLCMMSEGLSQKAGRIWEIGNAIPDSILYKFELDTENIITENTTLMLVFTKRGQDYSEHILKELQEMMKFIPLDSIYPINIYSGIASGSDTVSGFKTVSDGYFSYNSDFGLKVYPTIFILNKKGVILAYFPGFNQASVKNITAFFSTIYPTQFFIQEPINVSKKDKQQLRRVSLARKLYLKGRYELALQELSHLDSLSIEGRTLLGFALIQSGQLDSAKSVFSSSLFEQTNYIRAGLGIIAFKNGNYQNARNYFDAISTMKDMYRVHYWKGMIYEQLNETEKAKNEFKKSTLQSYRRIEQPFLP